MSLRLPKKFKLASQDKDCEVSLWVRLEFKMVSCECMSLDDINKENQEKWNEKLCKNNWECEGIFDAALKSKMQVTRLGIGLQEIDGSCHQASWLVNIYNFKTYSRRGESNFGHQRNHVMKGLHRELTGDIVCKISILNRKQICITGTNYRHSSRSQAHGKSPSCKHKLGHSSLQ